MQNTKKAVTDSRTVAGDNFADFKCEIAANLMRTIRDLKRNGTVGMSERNLLQVTPTPRNSRGPIGTNAQWVYAQMFNEVIESLKANRPSYRKFIY